MNKQFFLGLLVILPIFLSGLVHAAEWKFCANEHELCDFKGLKAVRYGADEKFEYRVYSHGVSCNNKQFGDPASGIVKHCDTANLTQWKFCSNENGLCDFKGVKAVRYGAEGNYDYRIYSDGVNCNNNELGDPAHGIVKHCYTADLR